MGYQFELSKHYSLLQAFDRIGEHLFASQWAGTEVWARPVEDPDQIRRERNAINERLNAIDAEVLLLGQRMARADCQQERAALHVQRSKLTAEANALHERRSTFPELGEPYFRDHDAFLRRQKTQEVLMVGLSEGAIHAQFGNGTLIDWKTWSRADGFKLYISLSMAVVPGKLSSLRRAPVFFARYVFEDWLGSVEAIVERPVTELSPQKRCEALIKAIVNAGSWRKKDDCWHEAVQSIPELSKRAFNQAWSNAAPDHWKKSGRRSA